MQLTTKSFHNFTSVSLRCANVTEQVLLEVVLPCSSICSLVFRGAVFPQAQRVADRGGKVTNSRGGRWGRVPPGRGC